MNANLKRQFIYVHNNCGENQLGSDLMRDLLNTPGVSKYQKTITITCSDLVGLSELLSIGDVSSMNYDLEGPDLQFRAVLRRKLVDFIG